MQNGKVLLPEHGPSRPSQAPRKKLEVRNDRRNNKEKKNCICGLSGRVCLCICVCVFKISLNCLCAEDTGRLAKLVTAWGL